MEDGLLSRLTDTPGGGQKEELLRILASEQERTFN